MQIELNIVKIKNNESICSYNNCVEELFQKLCNTLAVDKPKNEVIILRENIKEQSLVSYITG